MKVITVVGARPQFIKAAAVSRAFCAHAGIDEFIIHTGQHYDSNMSDIFFDELEIPKPTYHLEIGSGSHGAQTGRMLEAIEKILLETPPDWVLVYGDTNSTLAGALAAAKLHIPVAHVEAGLRSFNRKMPEEINRVMTDHVSNLLFAPTQTAVKNLAAEGLASANVVQVGDVMLDASLFYAEKASTKNSVLKNFNFSPKKYILATVHRAENTDNPARLKNIFQAFNQVADQWPIVLPLHPRTKKFIEQIGIKDLHSNIKVIDPIGYLDMIFLEKNAALIATDSGGVQKEAYFFGVPCVTLRDETEWVELVETGWNRLISPSNPNSIAEAMLGSVLKPGQDVELYGSGHAAQKIVEMLSAFVRCV